ncbi:hypothetical protein GALMADRAFT_215127 [Galerina marginata CBS 339.88]|uniref:Uncharacterized protein n=1 Tax=Galerina marginata (strain CBS 339.88) TaxID=685588 RepID=A0A067SP70_GALM3|nr:hypothetical protein GALMADRAFT_215127 [Galerina marginata CBS 339.88]
MSEKEQPNRTPAWTEYSLLGDFQTPKWTSIKKAKFTAVNGISKPVEAHKETLLTEEKFAVLLGGGIELVQSETPMCSIHAVYRSSFGLETRAWRYERLMVQGKSWYKLLAKGVNNQSERKRRRQTYNNEKCILGDTRFRSAVKGEKLTAEEPEEEKPRLNRSPCSDSIDGKKCKSQTNQERRFERLGNPDHAKITRKIEGVRRAEQMRIKKREGLWGEKLQRNQTTDRMDVLNLRSNVHLHSSPRPVNSKRQAGKGACSLLGWAERELEGKWVYAGGRAMERPWSASECWSAVTRSGGY